MARKVLSTPIGRAVWPHLHAPDTKFDAAGVYQTKLELGPEEGANLAAIIDARIDNAVADAKAENPKKRIKRADAPYSVDEETGNYIINFKLKASGTTRAGKEFTQKPNIFDASGNPVPDGLKVGGGSRIRVAFEPFEFFTALIGAGVSLRMKAVQVVELVEFGAGSADYFGFDAEEGGFDAGTAKSSVFSDASDGENEDADDDEFEAEDEAEDDDDF